VTRSGPVFYAAGEGKANLEKERVTAWEVANGLEPYGADNLYVGEGMIANDDETISADIGQIKRYFWADVQPLRSLLIPWRWP
jgi:hypothetical protein